MWDGTSRFQYLIPVLSDDLPLVGVAPVRQRLQDTEQITVSLQTHHRVIRTVLQHTTYHMTHCIAGNIGRGFKIGGLANCKHKTPPLYYMYSIKVIQVATRMLTRHQPRVSTQTFGDVMSIINTTFNYIHFSYWHAPTLLGFASVRWVEHWLMKQHQTKHYFTPKIPTVKYMYM